jgi:hypothetical protein
VKIKFLERTYVQDLRLIAQSTRERPLHIYDPAVDSRNRPKTHQCFEEGYVLDVDSIHKYTSGLVGGEMKLLHNGRPYAMIYYGDFESNRHRFEIIEETNDNITD